MKNLGNQFKIWAFPLLMSVTAWFLVNSVNTIQKKMDKFDDKVDAINNDIKILLVQSNVNSTESRNNKEDIDELREQFNNKTSSNYPVAPPIAPVNKTNFVFINDQRFLTKPKKNI